jgi:hypothetical protein
VRDRQPTPDPGDISRCRAELLAILAALEAFAAQYHAAAAPTNGSGPNAEVR